jgi:hypothetical protein
MRGPPRIRHDAARQGAGSHDLAQWTDLWSELMRNTLAAMTAAIATLLAAPTAAPAATVTITGDAGAPVTLNPGAPTPIRQMHGDLNVALGGTEKAFDMTVAGPVAAAASPRTCTSSSIPWGVDYQGNGTYTVTVTTYTNATCTAGKKTASYPVAINAGVSLGAPPGPVLTRQPNSFVTNTLQIPVGLNPGALTHDLRVALGGVLAPDGSISGPSKEVFADTTTGTAAVRLDAPGSYLMVGRATGYTGAAGQFFSPWSAPITIRAFAPFDFVGAPRCTDCRGPRYKVRGQVREKSATGKVRIKVARGNNGGRFRSIGKARIRNGVFKKTFTLQRPGVYRAKYIFKGSATTAPGTIATKFRITRRFF